MDTIDKAQAIEQLHRDAALARIKPAAAPAVAATHCQDCGEPIPEARRMAVPGAKRCAFCQSQAE